MKRATFPANPFATGLVEAELLVRLEAAERRLTALGYEYAAHQARQFATDVRKNGCFKDDLNHYWTGQLEGQAHSAETSNAMMVERYGDNWREIIAANRAALEAAQEAFA